jgi:hypothetical protein
MTDHVNSNQELLKARAEEEEVNSSESSQEMNPIPLNQSMIKADKQTGKRSHKNRRRGKGKSKTKTNNNTRGRSNTTEEEIGPMPREDEPEISIKIDESYWQDEERKVQVNTKASAQTIIDVDINSNLFVSRMEDKEEVRMLDASCKEEFDVITEVDSKLSYTTRESTYDVIQELYLGEPRWHKSSSWVKPMPHRVYKIRTIWTKLNQFDTEVHRRYSHFIWLRKILVKELEYWAVPVLPDKSIFERFCRHESDFIKERIRKMKHFLTLVRSHRKLQQSDYLKAFLCESKNIFKSTIKSLKLQEDTDKSPVVQKTKGWLSLASSSFGNMITKAKDFNVESIIPSIKNILSSSNETNDSGDLRVKKYAEKLEILKQSFIDLYKLANEIQESRSAECKLERGFNFALESFTSIENQDLKKMVDNYEGISKVRGNDAYDNLVKIENLIYAIESHLVWIESVQDLIERKDALWNKLVSIKEEMKNSPLNHYEIESCRYLLNLTERREKIIRGIIAEMEKLTIGTKDFYPRYVDNGFLVSQYEFYKKGLISYSII